MAKALADLDAKVAVLDLNPDAARAVAADIKKNGGAAIAVKANVLERASLEAARDEVLKAFGGIDVLINGAGGNKKDANTSDTLSFFNIPPEALRFVFELNLVGTVMPSQVFGKVMTDAKAGVIINTSSMNAFRPLTKVVGYSAAKAGVSNFTMWLAVHMSQNYSKDIRVNAIAPGFFLTEQNRYLLTDEKTGQMTPRGKTIIDHTPMGRYGEPSDLIGTVVWLIGDGSKFVHGTVIPIDGGFSAFSGV
jgi:NAD(P)-dependent dehydrogenase (short-subunit alcohol dehydrogenase family)